MYSKVTGDANISIDDLEQNVLATSSFIFPQADSTLLSLCLLLTSKTLLVVALPDDEHAEATSQAFEVASRGGRAFGINRLRSLLS